MILTKGLTIPDRFVPGLQRPKYFFSHLPHVTGTQCQQDIAGPEYGLEVGYRCIEIVHTNNALMAVRGDPLA